VPEYAVLRRVLWRVERLWKFEIESPFKTFPAVLDSVALSISNNHKTLQTNALFGRPRIPNAYGGNGATGQTQIPNKTTSLSKRENMHGLAWAACLTLWGSRGIYVPRRWTLRPEITCSGTYLSLREVPGGKKNEKKGICTSCIIIYRECGSPFSLSFPPPTLSSSCEEKMKTVGRRQEEEGKDHRGFRERYIHTDVCTTYFT